MPTHIAGMLTRDEQVKLYGEIMGIKIDNFDFYYCFGLFRLAVIAQQIYYRFSTGRQKMNGSGPWYSMLRFWKIQHSQ